MFTKELSVLLVSFIAGQHNDVNSLLTKSDTLDSIKTEEEATKQNQPVEVDL